MSVLPLNGTAAPVSEGGASHEPSTAKSKADVSGAGVNASQMARWLDDAIAMRRKAASDPVEFQRLGIWLQRMRRAVG